MLASNLPVSYLTVFVSAWEEHLPAEIHQVPEAEAAHPALLPAHRGQAGQELHPLPSPSSTPST